ncbi:hypothetical protein IAD21_01775 [Abditibacteriota bacterium]|nr:hypothetical protein IAD21_01775 [Abditibacteriota bacterium]
MIERPSAAPPTFLAWTITTATTLAGISASGTETSTARAKAPAARTKIAATRTEAPSPWPETYCEGAKTYRETSEAPATTATETWAKAPVAASSETGTAAPVIT